MNAEFKAIEKNVFSKKGDFWCIPEIYAKIVYDGDEMFYGELFSIFTVYVGSSTRTRAFTSRLQPGDKFSVRGYTFRLWLFSERPRQLAFDIS